MKQKSTFSILLLISILLFTLYYQNSMANKNYLLQIESNYKKNFDNYYNSFKRDLLRYYETQTIFIKDNPNLIAKIIQKEKFLEDIRIINRKKSKKTTPYSNMIKIENSFLDIQVAKEKILYKITVPIKYSSNNNSYIEYTLDSRIFLDSIKNFDGSDGVLFIRDNDKTNDIFLKENKGNKFFQTIISKCEASKHSPVVKHSSKFYVKKELALKNYKNNEVANAIFFLDITKDKNAYKATLKKSLYTTIILFMIAAIVVNYFFSYLVSRVEKNEKKLKKINKNLETLVEKEIENRLEVEKKSLKEKEKNNQLLIQQSKLAMLGEMIGNIAHQWRQPLMQLSAILMYLDAYNEKGKLTNERLVTKIKDGNSIIDFMSKTIEDFKNYYKPEKQKEEFIIRESIDNALFIVQSAIKDANINVSINCKQKDLKLTSYKNEFSQALLNIITNAKDILIQRNINEPNIDIKVFKENKKINIHILDNAGGISDKIINKIFDPYFTTKHQSQGTGIGLYMTKMIIENNMNGTLNVHNEKDGAIFVISLPEID